MARELDQGKIFRMILIHLAYQLNLFLEVQTTEELWWRSNLMIEYCNNLIEIFSIHRLQLKDRNYKICLAL